MLDSEVFARFLNEAPVCVMLRATLERTLSAQAMDELFRNAASEQYERELLFSTLVDVMSLVVCRVQRSVHAAYQRRRESIPVSVKSLYNKLNGVEPETSRALVCHTAQVAGELVTRLGQRQPLLRGYLIQVWDGNHLEGTDHRLEVLREEAGAALPGLAVAVLDPQRRIIVDSVVCEDAYVQETRLVHPLLERLRPKDVVISDRLYCTSEILFEISSRRAYFITRQHLGHLRWRLVGRRRCRGRTETGILYEQELEVTHPQTGEILRIRRISIQLDQPTRDGDHELHILTNLPARATDAALVAHLYRHRWTLETAFQELTTHFRCEPTTLGYPPAALFAFCVAAACYNVFAVIHAALRSVHGQDTIEEQVSTYYLTEELSGTYRGLMIALPEDGWNVFGSLTLNHFVQQLRRWARGMNLSRYQKHSRGPKSRTKRAYAPTKHVATARLLAERKSPP